MGSSKQITLDLSEYLDDFWGIRDRAQVSQDKAILIASIDKDEQYCHVEFPDTENTITPNLLKPLVWRKKEWLSSYEKWKLDKRNSAVSRHSWNVFKENQQRVAKTLSLMSGMSVDSCLELAAKMLKKNPRVLEELGAKLEKPLSYDELVKKGIA